MKKVNFSGTGDGTYTPVPPSNTPQTPAGGAASGDTTPLSDGSNHRSDSLHQVLEQMRSLVLREPVSFTSDIEIEESVVDASVSGHQSPPPRVQASNTFNDQVQL